MWWTTRSAQKQREEQDKLQPEEEEDQEEKDQEEVDEEDRDQEEVDQEEVEEELTKREQKRIEPMAQIHPHNLVLSHHPNFKLLSNTTGTPVPSFPPPETPVQLNLSKPVLNLNTTPFNHQPNQLPPTTLPTLRIVENQPSSFSLPYPNPDLSFTSNYDSPTTSTTKPQERRISGLPSRARTSFKPLPSPLRQSQTNQQYQPTLNQLLSASPSGNVKENLAFSPSERGTQEPQTGSNSTHLNHNKVIYPTPSAAISSIIQTSPLKPIAHSSVIDQVMKEMEARTRAGPGLTAKVTFQDRTTSQPHQPTQLKNDRFQQAHGKEFEKSDSITNHYAAKRKGNQSSTILPDEAHGSDHVNQPNKRAKVSDLGYPKRVVSQPVMASNQVDKKSEIIKRQLELARARRKTGTNNSQLTQKAGTMNPKPSGFSSFGTRLFKSAMKTVTGVIKSTSQQLSTTPKTITKTTDGVGFGVPAGLGVGPAKVPPSPTKRNPSQQQPIRSIVKPPSNRLPPTGLDRVIRSTSTNTSNSLGGPDRRRVISGPPTSTATTLTSTKILSNRPQTRSQAIESAKLASIAKQTYSKPSWKPQTIPKPTNVKPKTIGSGTDAGALQTASTKNTSELKKNCTNEKTTNEKRMMITRSLTSSKLPQKILSQSQGQTIIRPTIQVKKFNFESTANQKVMKTSTSTTNSTGSIKSKETVVSICKSDKRLPTRLAQPIHPTKATTTRNKPTLSKSISTTNRNNIKPSSSLIRNKPRSSIHSSKLNSNGNAKLSSNQTHQKLSMIKKPNTRPSSLNKRRKSSLTVGTKAVSHRVSCKVSNAGLVS